MTDLVEINDTEDPAARAARTGIYRVRGRTGHVIIFDGVSGALPELMPEIRRVVVNTAGLRHYSVGTLHEITNMRPR